MFGKLEVKENLELLKSQLIGHLGCCANGLPYVVPISYGFDGRYIYGYTFDGKKVSMARQNPEVCFLVEDTTDLANWKSVVCLGTYEELQLAEQQEHAFRVLSGRKLPFINSKTMRLSGEWPFSPDRVEKHIGIFFRIEIKEMTGRFEKSEETDFFAS